MKRKISNVCKKLAPIARFTLDLLVALTEAGTKNSGHSIKSVSQIQIERLNRYGGEEEWRERQRRMH